MEILFVRFLKNPVGATYLHQITVLCGVFFKITLIYFCLT